MSAAGNPALTSGAGRAGQRDRSVCPFAIAGVGASAGGFEALTQLFAHLPDSINIAFVIVQHPDSQHTGVPPETLARASKLPVVEATDGTVVKPGHVFVLPSGTDIGLADGRLRLLPRDGESAHLPIDRFFRSLAEQRKSGAIGVVLSGTGSDGALGLEAIHAEGGMTFAQSAASVPPPERIAAELRRMARRTARDATPGERGAHHRKLAAGDTGFFRDPQVFACLRETVFPSMLQGRPSDAPIRIWVPGCRQGQEVYSIAMCLLESMAEARTDIPVQIFGTDVSKEAISTARAGRYTGSIGLDVSPERLSRYFIKAGGYYQAGRPIRDLCTFARHDVAKDPPFRNLDMISCRNLPMSLEAALRHKIISLFHRALKSHGILLPGRLETLGAHDSLFESLDKSHKVYRAVGAVHVALPGGEPTLPAASVPAPGGATNLQRHIERVLVSEYAPAGVLVNDGLDVVQYRGDTTPYLMPASGQASQSLLRMAREGLRPALRAAIREARASGQAVRKEGVRVRSRQELREFTLRVLPLKIGPSEDGWLILFEEPGRKEGAAAASLSRPKVRFPSGRASAADLERELAFEREFLGTVIEDRDRANEELQATNEDLLASNEQLHSVNEELECAEEELESANEELTTANQRLRNRNAELASVNSDLRSVLNSANIPMLIFGRDLSLRRFTRHAGKLFHISAGDLGRPIPELAARLNLPGIEHMLLDVIANLAPREADTQDSAGRWLKVAIRPYRTEENKLDGAVVTFTDIDLVKRREVRNRRLFGRTFEAPTDGVLVVDAFTGRILEMNQRLTEMLGVAGHEVEGREMWTVAELQPLAGSEVDLKRFSGTPYWHYEAGWVNTKSGERVKVDVLSIVHVLNDRDTIQFALREAGGAEDLRELTRREIQVLTLLALGNSTKQAAAALGIAFKTAVGHRFALMRKLGVHDTASMVRYAVRAGFVKA